MATNLVVKTANHTLTGTDSVVLGNAVGGAFTLTLPTAVSIAGRTYTLKKTDSSGNTVTLATTGGQTIDGAASASLSSQYQYMTVASDGSNWMIVGGNAAAGSGASGPTAFNFNNTTDKIIGSTQTSNTVTLSGITGAVAAACGTGCTAIARNGEWIGTAGSFANGDTIAIKQVASATNSTTTTATVYIGSISPIWQVTTNAWTMSQSSNYTTTANTLASIADGNMATGAATDISLNQWIEINTGSAVTTASVTIQQLSTWGAFYTNNLVFQYYNGTSWVSLFTVTGLTNNGAAITFNFASVTATRFRLYNPSGSNGYVAIGEISFP